MGLKKTVITKTALVKALDKKDFELISYNQNQDGSIAVEANKLYPVLSDINGPLYVPVPVTLNVLPGDGNDIKGIENDTLDTETTNDAAHFVKMLIDNNQLNGLSNQLHLNATHTITINEKGQRIIRRQGFSSVS